MTREMTRKRKKGKKAVKKRSNPAERKIPDHLPTKPVADVEKATSFALYGRSNTGKTTLAADFPKPLLLLDVQDNGVDSVRDVKDIDVMQVSEWEDVETVFYWLRTNPKKYKTVVIDTVTNVQHLAVIDHLARKGKATVRAGDWGTMARRDWGDVAGLLRRWITDYRDLPCNVVFVAQDRIFNFDDDEDNDPETELTPEIGPRLMPSVASHLNASVSIIGNTFIRIKYITKAIKGEEKELEKIQYCLRVGPNPIYVTKVRKPKSVKVPQVIVNPTFQKLVDIQEG